MDTLFIELFVPLHSFALGNTLCLAHTVPHIAEYPNSFNEATGCNLGVRKWTVSIHFVPNNSASAMEKLEVIDPPDYLMLGNT